MSLSVQDYTSLDGWCPDAYATAEFIETLPKARFCDALEGGIQDDNREILLYECIGKLAPDQLLEGRLISRDQGQWGSCVGNGAASAADLTTAAEIVIAKQPERWVARQAADATYVGSRDITGQRGGQGSYGGAAAKFFLQWGSLHMVKYSEQYDLTQYSTRFCARNSLPEELKAKAAEHKFGTVALVKTKDECRQALQNGYGVFICSNQGFSSHRDANGVSQPQGSWSHCMYIAAWRPGFFLIVNSWNNNWNSGGIYPASQPWGSFWADENLVERRILSGGDSYAVSNFNGFPRQSAWDWVDQL